MYCIVPKKLAKQKSLKLEIGRQIMFMTWLKIVTSVVSLRWVITEKVVEGKKKVKARLVARGFEEDTSEMRKDSPTCSREAVRLTVALASSNRWQCHSLDVTAAYLQGNDIDREIYVHPPPEYFVGKLWRLKKTVYGLSDAARAWYLRVKSELISLGVKVSTYDSSVHLEV